MLALPVGSLTSCLMAGVGAAGAADGGDAQPGATQRPLFGAGNVSAGCGLASVSDVAITMPTLTANHGVSIAPRSIRPYSGRDLSRLTRRRSRRGAIGPCPVEPTSSRLSWPAGGEVRTMDSSAGAPGWAGTGSPRAGGTGKLWGVREPRSAGDEAATAEEGEAATATEGEAAIAGDGGAATEKADEADITDAGIAGTA
jgi:hypothetical protein